MARPKGRPKGKRDDATTRFDRILLGKAHLIAKDRGVSIAEVISEAARPSIEKAYANLVRKIERSGG